MFCWYYRTLPQHEKAARFFRHAEKLVLSDTCQSIKHWFVTERLIEIYRQMWLHIIGCV